MFTLFASLFILCFLALFCRLSYAIILIILSIIITCLVIAFCLKVIPWLILGALIYYLVKILKGESDDHRN